MTTIPMKTNYKELTEFLRFLNKIYKEYKGEKFRPTAEEFEKIKERFTTHPVASNLPKK